MKRIAGLIWVTTVSLILLFGCGGSSVTTPPPIPSSAHVALTLHDSPPAGITVLSFEVAISGAVLQPGNVSLLKGVETLEITELQTKSAFLGGFDAPAGTYTSMTLTFANPALTILNSSGAAIGTCAASAICELQPALAASAVTLSNGPVFPLTLIDSIPDGLSADVNLALAIQPDLTVDLSAPGALSLAQLPAPTTSGDLQELDDVAGTIQTLGPSQFTMLTGNGLTFSITVESNTQFGFQGEGESCVANDFTCLAVSQVVKVNLELKGDGTFRAKELDFEDNTAMQDLKGTIVSIGVGPSPTSFLMVVHDEIPVVTGVAVGNLVTVSIQNGTLFFINDQNFAVPTGVLFATASDLLVGQDVQIRIVGTVSAGPPISLSTNRIDLHASEISATVSSVDTNTSTLTISNLPSLFTTAVPTAINQIQVQTSSQTQFDNFTPDTLAGVVAGNTVSVEGFLFNTVSSPTLVAKKVEGRSSAP